jgi:hypothetical protein
VIVRAVIDPGAGPLHARDPSLDEALAAAS